MVFGSCPEDCEAVFVFQAIGGVVNEMENRKGRRIWGGRVMLVRIMAIVGILVLVVAAHC